MTALLALLLPIFVVGTIGAAFLWLREWWADRLTVVYRQPELSLPLGTMKVSGHRINGPRRDQPLLRGVDVPQGIKGSSPQCSIPECESRAIGRGWCSLHWQRWKKTGDPLGILQPPDPVELFWQKVQKTDTCWLWTGAHLPLGYGTFRRKGKTMFSHRFAYEQLVGPIPPRFDLDHLCRVPACVNPAHLEAVTHAENCRRGLSSALRPSRVDQMGAV